MDIASINPFRYRGYYYDEEIGMYYLQSRYYNACVGRFVNEDDSTMLLITDSVISSNIFSYCRNEVNNYKDDKGYWRIPTWLLSATLDILFIALNAAMYAGYLSFSSRSIKKVQSQSNYTAPSQNRRYD